jgi:drug/metabolite transporter (DMT)-like permease
MNWTKILGIVLLAIGVTLLFLAYNASQTVGERVVEGVTGHFTNQTTWFLVGGVAASVAGAALAFWRKPGLSL